MKCNSLLNISVTLGLFLIIFNDAALLAQNAETIKVYGPQWGVSTRYIGAVEGNINFDLNDLQDLGINTYRIYGGMARWEAEDDDSVYGWPSIAEIKTNPNIINWAWWDTVMTSPPNGSDYWSSGAAGTTWQGNARTIFNTLKQAGIRPVLNIRNVDSSWNPAWAQQLNPPRTKADWNEWWEHVFATVYWLNVRHNYQVDEFEIHNEPEHRDQGWGGTQADYFELVKVAKDAIDHVYKTYLPGRTYYIHAPIAVSGSNWPLHALQQIPTYFDSISIHDYASDISDYTQLVHGWMNNNGHAKSPLWLGEWGTYPTGYDDLSLAINLTKNMIRGSQPGNSYIYGSHIFSLYDWGKAGGFKGLVGAKGEKRVSYYSARLGIRALQGGRPTFLTATSNANLTAITTRDSSGDVYLLVTNSGQAFYTINADLSALIVDGMGTVWEFSSKIKDEITGSLILNQGRIAFTIPANSAMLVRFSSTVSAPGNAVLTSLKPRR